MAKRALSLSAIALLALLGSGMQAMAEEAGNRLSESDAIAIGAADAACAAGEFQALFEAMAWSKPVRTKYGAPTINVERDGVASRVTIADYDDFPIALFDNYWVSSASVTAWEANPQAEIDHVILEFNQSQSDQWAVEWQIVRYDGKSEGGDDLGNVIEHLGVPSALIFEPYGDCWRLIADFRRQN